MRTPNFLFHVNSLLKPLIWLGISFLLSFFHLYLILLLFFLFLSSFFSFYSHKKKIFLVLLFYTIGIVLGYITFLRNPKSLTSEDINRSFGSYPQKIKVQLKLQEDSFLSSKGYQAGKVVIINSDIPFLNNKSSLILGFFPFLLKGEEVLLELLITEDWLLKEFIFFWIDNPSALERKPLSFINEYRLRILNSFDSFNNSLSPIVADWILAFFQGERAFILESEKDLFRQTGLIHLLALSGFHLGFWAFGLSFLLSILLPRRIVNFLLPFLLIFYLLSVGLYPSLVRAWFFVFIIMFYNFNYFKKEPLSMISLTMILSLTFFPYLFYSLGFWLSLAAFSAIVLYRTGNFFIISLRIFIFTSPFLLFSFGEVPLAGFLLTPIIGFLISLFMLFSFLIYLIYWIPFLLYFFNFLDYFLSLIIHFILWIIEFSLPFNIVIGWKGFFIGLVFYGFFLFLGLSFRMKLFWKNSRENLNYEN